MKVDLKYDQVIYPKVLIFCLARALGYPAPKGLLPRKFGRYARTTFVPLQLGR